MSLYSSIARVSARAINKLTLSILHVLKACACITMGTAYGLAFCGLLGLAVATADIACQRQELVRCKPRQLGVASLELMGQLMNDYRSYSETIVLHAFVKIVRHSSITHLRGYGWIEHLKEHVSEYGPVHKQFTRKPLPPMYVRPMVNMSWGSYTRVDIMRSDSRNLAFRMDAIMKTTGANLFQIRVQGWPRTVQLALEDFKAWPGVLTPFYNMAATGNNETESYNPLVGFGIPARRLLAGKEITSDGLPLPSQSPLVAVVFLGFAPFSGPELIARAQQLLRHVEYHILQAGMQRVLIYIRENVFTSDILRDYISRHLPSAVLPYVTFVVWNEVPIVDASAAPDLHSFRHGVYWDQNYVYYHAAVAMADHPSALVSFIDLDEYIAWPKPAKSLHEALALCSSTTDKLVSLGLTSMYALCHDCNYEVDMHSEQRIWTSVQRNDISTDVATDVTSSLSSCRWYTQDPLTHYNWTWDDTWLEQNKMTWAKHRTSNTVWKNRGKQLLRTIKAKTFCHHMSEGLEDKQRFLDPDTCPFIAHLPNLHGYRGNHSRGGLQWFAKKWQSKWWLVADT